MANVLLEKALIDKRDKKLNMMLQMKVLFYVALFAMTFSTLFVQAETVYKYKDQNGKWVFSDKPPVPQQGIDQNVEQQEYANKRDTVVKPSVYVARDEQQYLLMVRNPFHAPIEVEVKSSLCNKGLYHQVIKPKQIVKACKSHQVTKNTNTSYRWAMGNPKAIPDGTPYAIPLGIGLERQITQSFRGRFSHHSEPSLYAVDIALPIGTNLTAARGGTVVSVKDDYHMGWATEYFLDKANFVRIVHDDGTFGDYGHILMGTAQVKPGDKVATGDIIARSGTSGFSTGPHLHFVIRRNVGFEYRSVKFSFIDALGNTFTPQAGMKIKGF